MSRPSARVALLLAFLAPAGLVAAEFPQAPSAALLRQAEGQIFDITQFDADPHWDLQGQWLLSCGVQGCGAAAPEEVGFDLALIMVRPDGNFSHSHTFTDFHADSVTVIDDSLYITGTIVGTGGVGGLTDVEIDIIGVSGAAELRLRLPGNEHIVGEIGGVTVRSR